MTFIVKFDGDWVENFSGDLELKRLYSTWLGAVKSTERRPVTVRSFADLRCQQLLSLTRLMSSVMLVVLCATCCSFITFPGQLHVLCASVEGTFVWLRLLHVVTVSMLCMQLCCVCSCGWWKDRLRSSTAMTSVLSVKHTKMGSASDCVCHLCCH